MKQFIISNNIYRHYSIPPLKITPTKKKKTAITMSTKKKIFFLLACTRHVPLNDHLGNIYSPTDGVAMGSPPGT